MGAEHTATFLVLILAATANISLGFLVLAHNGRSLLNRRFFLLTVFCAGWVITNLLFPIAAPELRLTLALLSYLAAGLLALQFVLFCNVLTERAVSSYRERLHIAVGVMISGLSATPGVVATSVSNELRIDTNPVQLFIYGAYVAGSLLFALSLLFRKRLNSSSREKSRVDLVLKGMAIGVAIGILFNLVLPIFNEYRYVQYGPLGTLIFMAMTAYAIVRHGLFDIKLAAIRTVGYVLTLATLSVVYFTIAYLASVTIFEGNVNTGFSVSPINIALALILAFIFQPIKRFFDRATDRIFYRNQYDTNEFIARLSEVLTSTTDLRTLLQRAASEIGNTLKAEQAHFLVEYADSKHMVVGTRGASTLVAADFRQIKDAIASDKTDIFITELLARDHPLNTILSKGDIAILMPIRHKRLTLGFLALGHQLSGSYAKRDISVLSTISDSLLIAIQNSLSVQEIREINAHLKQRIDAATKELRYTNSQLKKLDVTKDEFISMASHQLRTPLTAVKGYISMVLEGDLGKITPDQRKVLDQAFESSQRMVFLIGDFLNVSRIQTGKFMLELTEKSLVDLIPEEIDQLTDTARVRQIKLKYDGPESLPATPIDENKVRQVMMNFIDNAIYYSRPNSTISVRLYRDGDGVVFKVIDTGIGVPKSEQAHLFTKFFRATNARQQRPDGTGIGLYMAKKVVLAHGGTIIFETTEGKGSTFGFRLPLEDKLK